MAYLKKEISVLYFMKYKPEAISLKMLPQFITKHLDLLWKSILLSKQSMCG